MTKVKTHVVFPEEVLKDIDQLVGTRKRSGFVVQATKEKLERERLGRALAESNELWKKEDYPEFGSVENIDNWVNKIRSLDSRRKID